MGDYLRSLEACIAREDERYLPGHGPPIDRPRPFVRAYLGHRRMRECQILRCLDDGAATGARDGRADVRAFCRKACALGRREVDRSPTLSTWSRPAASPATARPPPRRATACREERAVRPARQCKKEAAAERDPRPMASAEVVAIFPGPGRSPAPALSRQVAGEVAEEARERPPVVLRVAFGPDETSENVVLGDRSLLLPDRFRDGPAETGCVVRQRPPGPVELRARRVELPPALRQTPLGGDDEQQRRGLHHVAHASDAVALGRAAERRVDSVAGNVVRPCREAASASAAPADPRAPRTATRGGAGAAGATGRAPTRLTRLLAASDRPRRSCAWVSPRRSRAVLSAPGSMPSASAASGVSTFL